MTIKKDAKRCFKDLVNILDIKSDYYILNYYINQDNKDNKDNKDDKDNKDNKENKEKDVNDVNNENNNPVTNVNSVFVAKNADHIPLPLPRDNPDSIYRVGGETREATDSRENVKIDIINIDIDDKNTCYVKNCKNCKNRNII
jgi:hypothetical protein